MEYLKNQSSSRFSLPVRPPYPGEGYPELSSRDIFECAQQNQMQINNNHLYIPSNQGYTYTAQASTQGIAQFYHEGNEELK